jgi:Flagellar hook-length control protein FliK
MIENDLQVLTRTANTPKRAGGAKNAPIFHKHDTVIGNVLKSSVSGTALLLINGEKVRVKTHVPLRTGTRVTLQVKETSTVPTLKYMGEKMPTSQTPGLSVILSAIKGNIWKTVMESALLSNLKQDDRTNILALMRNLTTNIYRGSSPHLLKTLINMSGLNLEAKIKKALGNNFKPIDIQDLVRNDLKGLISKLLGQDPKEQVHLKALWTALEGVQILNQEGLEEGRRVFLPIPMQFPDGVFSVAQLLLQLPSWDDDTADRKSKQDPTAKATFLLEMSRLGPIRAEVILRGKTIDGVFLVAESRTKRILEDNLPSLMDHLRDMGFSIHHVGCFLKDPQIVTESPLQDIIQVEKSSICMIG